MSAVNAMSRDDNPGEDEQIVRRLLEVISRRRPMNEAAELLDVNVIAHMDGRIVGRSSGAWRRWVRFLHYNADKRMSSLTIEVDSVSRRDDVVSVAAHWRGEIDGQEQLSDAGTVSYRVRDGKICEIWTHRANYVFIYGAKIKSIAGFGWVLLRLLLWRGKD